VLRLGSAELRALLSRELNQAHTVLDEWDSTKNLKTDLAAARAAGENSNAVQCGQSNEL
jgi:hypothetical protein